jgi:hypothetical protein
MKELLSRNRLYKVVCTNDRNEDQDLFGFYETKDEAREACMSIQKKCPEWITSWRELIIKRVDPELISRPVTTDYEHYLRSLIPDEEWGRVLKSDASAEINCNDMTCGRGTYYMLSKMIPKDWTVIDFGCAYNAQSYLFQEHARHIAIEPVWNDKDFHFEYFKAHNTELLFMTGQEFIQKELPKMHLNLDKTFAICNYVPSGACNLLARETFKNIYTYYPS